MKLGDVDELEERMLSYYELARSGDWVLREEIKDFFDNTPTIDPVKHGNWVSKNGWVSCSVCGLEPPNETNTETPYCPNCGARMDG